MTNKRNGLFLILDLKVVWILCLFLFVNNIYFFSGRYGCSNVVVADAVADVVVVAGPAFVACYHCHLPRSLNKHGASLEAPYPLHISQFLISKIVKTLSMRFCFLFFTLLHYSQSDFLFFTVAPKQQKQ